MRAVNLIPGEAAGGARGGLGVAALLGGLAVLLALVTVHVLTGNQIADRQNELASAQRQVATAQAQADATRPYREFASLAKARVRDDPPARHRRASTGIARSPTSRS